MESIKLVPRRHEKDSLSPAKTRGYENAKKAGAFHQSVREHTLLPLAELEGPASELGIKHLYIKDESNRSELKAAEAVGQLGDVRPTHVFLRSGDGTKAGAVAAFLADYYGDEERPLVVIVESDKADCLYRTARGDAGSKYQVIGEMYHEKAALCCDGSCALEWEVLKDFADIFVSVPVEITELGMHRLRDLVGGDKKIAFGESVATDFGVLYEACTNKDRAWLKAGLKLDENSVVMCIPAEVETTEKNIAE